MTRALIVALAVTLSLASPAAAQASILPFCDLRDACHSVVPHLDHHLDAADVADALERRDRTQDSSRDHDGRERSDRSTRTERSIPAREFGGTFCQKPDGERHWWTYHGRMYWHDHHFDGRTGRTHLAGYWAMYDRYVCQALTRLQY